MIRVPRLEFIENQIDYCKWTEKKFLLPQNGFCPFCGQDFVSYFISLDLTGKEFYVKRCPLCGREFDEINKT